MRVFLALFASALAVPTYASAIFTIGNNPQPGEDNVVFATDQSAALITGVTKMTGDIVDFLSTTDELTVTAKGQSNVTAVDGLINNLSIDLANGAGFLDLIFNPSADNNTDSGATTVTVQLKSGGTGTYQYPGNLGNGQNFLTITTDHGDRISSVTIDSDGGFESLRQVRISGLTGAVPEPGSMALIGGGLLFLAPFIRRRGRA
jgi:PEP-CTERM motif